MRRLAAIALIVAACSKPPARQQQWPSGRAFGGSSGAPAATGTDTAATDTSGTLKGGAGGGPGSSLVGATVTGLDTAGTQEWTPDVSTTTAVSTTSTGTTTTTATGTTTNPWHVPTISDTSGTH